MNTLKNHQPQGASPGLSRGSPGLSGNAPRQPVASAIRLIATQHQPQGASPGFHARGFLTTKELRNEF